MESYLNIVLNGVQLYNYLRLSTVELIFVVCIQQYFFPITKSYPKSQIWYLRLLENEYVDFCRNMYDLSTTNVLKHARKFLAPISLKILKKLNYIIIVIM